MTIKESKPVNMVITAGFIEKPLRAVNREFAGKLSTDIKKILHVKRVYSQELNTWLLHEATFSDTLSEKEIESFEDNYQLNFTKYHNTNVVKLLQRDIQRDRELKETSSILTGFLQNYSPDLDSQLKSQLKSLQIEIPELIKQNVSKNIVILWQNNTNYRFQFNGMPAFEFTQEDLLNKDFNLINLIDKAIIFNFFSIWADPTIKLIQQLNTTLSRLYTFLMNNTTVMMDDERLHEKFELYLRIIVAKLSSLEQTASVLSRIYLLHEDLKKELLKVADPELLSKIHLREIFDSQNAISKVAIQLLNAIEEKAGLSKNQIREKTTTSISLNQFKKDYHEFVLLTTTVFMQIQKLKLWTEKFLDVPYFTFSSALFSDYLQDSKETNIDSDIILSAKGLFKTYRLGATTVYALRGMNLDIRKGEFLVIFGTSGAGKTTLLNCIAGLDSPDRGVVYFEGSDIHKMNDKERSNLRLHEMGFIFQNFALLPHYTTKENVTLPSDLAGLSNELRQRINDLLTGVGINLQSKQFPSQLSGGQMQRVSIARSLTNQPTIIFADEPTGDLDSVTGKQVLDLLKKFHDETGTTVVIITHDQMVADYASRVVTVKDGIITSDTLKN